MTRDDTLEPTTIRTQGGSTWFVDVDTYGDDEVHLAITMRGGRAYCMLSPEQVDQLIAALQARRKVK